MKNLVYLVATAVIFGAATSAAAATIYIQGVGAGYTPRDAFQRAYDAAASECISQGGTPGELSGNFEMYGSYYLFTGDLSCEVA